MLSKRYFSHFSIIIFHNDPAKAHFVREISINFLISKAVIDHVVSSCKYLTSLWQKRLKTYFQRIVNF